MITIVLFTHAAIRRHYWRFRSTSFIVEVDVRDEETGITRPDITRLPKWEMIFSHRAGLRWYNFEAALQGRAPR
jgi:hypothetical protein